MNHKDTKGTKKGVTKILLGEHFKMNKWVYFVIWFSFVPLVPLWFKLLPPPGVL